MSIPGNAYVANSGNVSLTGGVAKTVIGLTASGTNQAAITELNVSFSGSTVGSDPNCLVELVYGTNVSNWPGINSSLITPVQLRGWPAQPTVQQAGANWTAEPTVLTIVKQWYVPGGGSMIIQSPLGREPSSIITQGVSGKFVGIRCTSGANPTQARISIEYEE